jgi:AcrR family transcriptional regulator
MKSGAGGRAVRPRGRDEVRAALIDAGARLFAARGIESVSVRDVAFQARVNHGLIYRHFGSKARFLSAVMEHLAREVRDGGDAEGTPDRAVESSLYFRVLARALLEGHDPRRLQRSFPVVRALVARGVTAKSSGALPRDVDVRMLTALGVAAGLGWLVFEPYLIAAVGFPSRSRAATRARARGLWDRLVDGLGPR